MVMFLLSLCFDPDALGEDLPEEDFCNIADGVIKRMMEMPAVPRVGEEIDFGNAVIVKSVVHQLRKKVIEVECDISLFDGVVIIAEFEDNWDMEDLAQEGKVLLTQKVKEYKEANK